MTSLVLIALAVILGGSLLAEAMTPVDAAKKLRGPNPGCDEDKGKPLANNPNCGVSWI
jgi:hypothetical protein